VLCGCGKEGGAVAVTHLKSHGRGGFRVCQISWPAPNNHSSSSCSFNSLIHCSAFPIASFTLVNQMSRIQPQKNLNTLFNARFEPFPRPVNCTTFTATDTIVKDERHPLNIPFSRRLDEWNPKQLHWIIRTPLSISKKRTIRSWVTRRFRDTFIDELKNSGFNRRGEPLVPSRLKSPLTGALAITLLPPVLTASVQDVRHICSSILRKHVFSRQRPTR